MKNKLSLASRRRISTLEEIQNAAVSLALEVGPSNLTAVMISKKVGISLRSFFNYYENKDHALLGPGNWTADEVLKVIHESNVPLLESFEKFVVTQLMQAEGKKEVLRSVMKLSESSPYLNNALLNEGGRLRESLQQTILLRKPRIDATMAHFYTDVVLSALRLSFERWVASDEDCIQDVVSGVFSDLKNFIRLVPVI